MLCPYCGKDVQENTAFCIYCGNPLNAAPPYPQQPTPPYQPNAPMYPQPDYYLPMKWYKFLIYFALWLGALLNLINGFQMVTGGQYGYEKELVYHYFGGLQALDVIVGLCTLAMAGLGVYTALRLIGYYKNGPKLLTYLYAGVIIVNVVYFAGLNIVVPEVVEMLDMSTLIIQIAVSAVMVFVNKAYFAKRTKFFTKG